MHHTHPEINKRLRRAEGHLRVTIALLEEGRSCADIAQQLHAVEKAIGNAKKMLIHDHIDHCLEQSGTTTPEDKQRMVGEFKHISKYL